MSSIKQKHIVITLLMIMLCSVAAQAADYFRAVEGVSHLPVFADVNSAPTPAAGALVYSTDANNPMIYSGSAWTAIGGSPWTIGGSDISYNTGNVGIGTVSPAVALDVSGDIRALAQGDVRLADADSSNYVALQSPADVTADVIWTLPAVDGNTGQLLRTDGSGALSWTSVSGTIVDGTDANNTLRWNGTGWVESSALANDGSNITLSGDLAVNGGDITSTSALTVTPNGGTNLNVALSTTGDFIVNTDDLVVDTSTGRVGIGTASPGQLLELSNTAGTASLKLTGSGANVIHSIASEYDINYYRTSGWAIMDFRAVPQDTNSPAQYRFGISSGSAGTNSIYLYEPDSSTIQTRISSSGAHTYFNAQGGNVGIGTATPDAKLEVNGQIKITGGSPGLGKILTSDADGKATWDTAINDQASSGYFDVGTMRMQWGIVTYSNDNPTAMTLPASFANSTYSVILSVHAWEYNSGKGPADVSNPVSVTAKSTTTFTANRDNDLAYDTTFDWFAIGLKP